MSAVSFAHTERVEHVVNQLVSGFHSKYPHITLEVVYNPPDEGDAWIILNGTTDADELDEISDYGLSMRAAAFENEGILVLVL